MKTTLTPEALQRAMAAACEAGEYAELPNRVYDALIAGWEELQPASAADVPEHLDVRRIMLDVVPGPDGIGHEVYARNVEDVERKLNQMGDRIADLDHAAPVAAGLPDAVALEVARRFTPDSEPQRRARLQVAIVAAIASANSDHIPSEYELVHESELRSLRERATVKLQTERGELWYWQGDGHDFPESLSCPVVMSADALRELIAARRPVADDPEGGSHG